MYIYVAIFNVVFWFLSALNISFGSLYSDEVLISAVKAISVLACATLLGLV